MFKKRCFEQYKSDCNSSNILQIWDCPDYPLDNKFGRDHISKTDIIKSIDRKKDNCIINQIFFNLFNFLANYLVFIYKQTKKLIC